MGAPVFPSQGLLLFRHQVKAAGDHLVSVFICGFQNVGSSVCHLSFLFLFCHTEIAAMPLK